jgi:Rrf2 family transcriptional regulator, cysteine metabolism repressor
MKLPRTIAYAIHAISRLAMVSPGVPVPCSQLAREGQMPERFLLQILRKLVNHGVLESTCGVAGGYYLSRPPEQITLSEVMEAIDDTLEFSMPMLGCMSPVVRAQITEAMRNASYAAIASFRDTTVADLISGDMPELQSDAPNAKPQGQLEVATGALHPAVLPEVGTPVTR